MPTPKFIVNWSGLKFVKEFLSNHQNIKTPDFVDQMIQHYSIRYKVKGEIQDQSGATVFVSTHHSGAADFLGAYQFLNKRVSNLKVLVNRELMQLEPIQRVGIATYPPSYQRKNDTTRIQIIEHLKSGGSLLVYPAGKVAQKTNGQIQDSPWRKGIFEISKEHAKKITPIYVDADNGSLFYFARKFFPRLSLLFILKFLRVTAKRTIPIRIGKPIDKTEFNELSPTSIMSLARNRTYQLGA